MQRPKPCNTPNLGPELFRVLSQNKPLSLIKLDRLRNPTTMLTSWLTEYNHHVLFQGRKQTFDKQRGSYTGRAEWDCGPGISLALVAYLEGLQNSCLGLCILQVSRLTLLGGHWGAAD